MASGIARISFPDRFDISLAMRGIAASLVVWWHTGGYHLKYAYLSPIYIPGRISVWIFFIISGYVIGYGFVNAKYDLNLQSLMKFYRNRILRIYPLFLCISIISLVTALGQGNTFNLNSRFFLKDFLLIQWYHTYTLSGVFWTLGVEIQFYIIMPLLFWAQMHPKSRLRNAVVLYFIFLLIPYVTHKLFDASFDNRTTLGNLAHFQAGIMVNYIRGWLLRQTDLRRGLWLWSPMFLASIVLFTAAYYYNIHPRIFWGVPGILLTDISGVLFLIAHCTGEITVNKVPGWMKGLAAVGVLSYGIYGWHGYLLKYFSWFENQLVATYLASFALAYITYLLIERPTLRLKWSPRSTYPMTRHPK